LLTTIRAFVAITFTFVARWQQDRIVFLVQRSQYRLPVEAIITAVCRLPNDYPDAV